MDGRTVRTGLRDEELAAAVLPPLLARVAASTARLRVLAAALGEPARNGSAAERTCLELAAEAREADTLGWLLGCVAGGLGSELLLDRHEPRAIALALELVAAALAAEGRQLAFAAAPDVTPQGGWRLAWALAGLVWRAGRAMPVGGRLDVSVGREGGEAGMIAAALPCEALAARALELASELDTSRLEGHARGCCWRFPSAWLEVPA